MKISCFDILPRRKTRWNKRKLKKFIKKVRIWTFDLDRTCMHSVLEIPPVSISFKTLEKIGFTQNCTKVKYVQWWRWGGELC